MGIGRKDQTNKKTSGPRIRPRRPAPNDDVSLPVDGGRKSESEAHSGGDEPTAPQRKGPDRRSARDEPKSGRSREVATQQKSREANGRHDRGEAIVELTIAKLKPHPSQALIFAAREPWQTAELAKSIEVADLEYPIEVDDRMQIICGHGRVAAFKFLGRKTIPGRIRYDLVRSGPEAVQTRLIEDNLHRRQLSRLDMARCYHRLLELARQSAGRNPNAARVQADLLKLIVERFRCSKKTVMRWLLVLELPLPLQVAVDSDQLPMTQAIKLKPLGKPTLDVIAARLTDGESARTVVAEYLRDSKAAQPKLSTLIARIIRCLELWIAILPLGAKDVPVGQHALEVLLRFRPRLEELIARGEHCREMRARHMQTLRERLSE